MHTLRKSPPKTKTCPLIFKFLSFFISLWNVKNLITVHKFKYVTNNIYSSVIVQIFLFSKYESEKLLKSHGIRQFLYETFL